MIFHTQLTLLFFWIEKYIFIHKRVNIWILFCATFVRYNFFIKYMYKRDSLLREFIDVETFFFPENPCQDDTVIFPLRITSFISVLTRVSYVCPRPLLFPHVIYNGCIFLMNCARFAWFFKRFASTGSMR